MTQLKIIQGLPFVAAKLEANGKVIQLEYVLIDTGAAVSIFNTDDLKRIGIEQQLTDEIIKMSGIGGDEYVIEKQIDKISVDNLIVAPFLLQIGSMQYGMRIDGILGTDFLQKTGAKIDFTNLTITK